MSRSRSLSGPQSEKLTKQGIPFYHSQSLLIEDNGLIFGELYKLSKSAASKFFGKNPYLQRHFSINWKRKEITSRSDFHPESKVKTVLFKNIAAVTCDEEKKIIGQKECPYTFKFSLILISTRSDFFAKS